MQEHSFYTSDISHLNFSIGFSVLQKSQENSGTLLGPGTERTAGVEGFSLSVSADSTHESPHGDNLLLHNDILQGLGGLPQVHSLDGLGNLPGGLEVGPQVESSGFHRCKQGLVRRR